MTDLEDTSTDMQYYQFLSTATGCCLDCSPSSLYV